jgi:23S rRNA (guanosine2251-2'-O)-methyltransferase
MAAETILYGYHPVIEALRAGRRRIHRILLAQGNKASRQEELQQLALQKGIDVQRVAGEALNRIVGHLRHQGVAAEVSSYPFCSLDDIVSLAHRRSVPPLVLVLDQILDPHNLGAMARTALCCGAHGMVITKDRSAQPTAASIKVSAGALEHLHVACVANLVNALNFLKEQGLWIAGADRHGAADLYATDLSIPLAVVIGGEEKGLRSLVKRNCDYTIAVPQTDSIGSLNASVCAGIILYESYRQRQAPTASGRLSTGSTADLNYRT